MSPKPSNSPVSPRNQVLNVNGARYLPGQLLPDAQRALAARIKELLAHAPPFTPHMPRTGRPFSVNMSNCGPLGWVSDKDGYRYQAAHPETGAPWPPMPAALRALWRQLTDYPGEPDACLVNLYGETARMGLHQDRDEADFDAPVISVSLGDSARFRIGTAKRGGKTAALTLHSGDVVILEGESRRAYHGIGRILTGSSDLVGDLLPPYRRINLSLRRAR